MRKILLGLIIATFSLMFCIQVQAKSVNDEQCPIVRLTKSTGKIRPRSVESCIYCYYYNSELSFDSYDDIINFTVSVTDESNGQTAMFYLSDMSETVGIYLSAGSYRIELRTFDGQTFEGVLTISE